MRPLFPQHTPPVAAKKKSADKPRKDNVVAAARGRGSASPFSAHRTWEWIKSIAGTLAIFLFLRTFFIEAYRIPSGSMIPSLLVGDWLFVNKLVYGPHVPFTSYNFPGYAEPKRGDIVVFESPYQPDLPENEDRTPTLVKRLIGMPGDTLYMREGLVYVNGLAQRQGYTSPEQEKGDPNLTDPLFDWQKRFGLAASRFGAAPAQPTHDNWGPFVVPDGHFWMMGDNRYASKDSRYWGFVPRKNVRGRPLFVYYSYDTEEGLDYFRIITEVRWRRIGHWLR
jgi:signal peptidase I